MKRSLFTIIALPVAATLLVTGCRSSSEKVAWEAQGGTTVQPRTDTMCAAGGVETASQADIELRKEELVVGKREISNGGVLIRTVVQTENVSQPIDLQREEYVIERVPASEAMAKQLATSPENVFKGREIYIPLTREEPVASKRALISEKVQIAKKIETDHETITRPVRSEDVEITKIAGKPMGSIWQESAAAPAAPTAGDSVTLLKEEMVVGKAVFDNGGVKLRKVVRTEDASQGIDLKREEFTINRTTAEPKVASSDFSQKELRLNLTKEQAVAGVRNFPTEYVKVRKQVHTDNQVVTGTVRKQNIEVVKLAPEQPAMGGVGSQSATSTISESGFAGESKPTTLAGKVMCGKCQLHLTANCQNILQTQTGGKTQTYYLVQNDVSKGFHENACQQAKLAFVTGTVQQVGDKLELTPTKIELTH